MSLLHKSIKELEEMLEANEITAEELTQASFERIKEVDADIHAFLTLNEEQAIQLAKALDGQNDSKNGLYGIPNGLKDNIVTKELRTTAGSKMLAEFDKPLYDATVVQKLADAKSVTVGKLNMDEFAMGSSNENSYFKLTRNPWNTDYVPGGSSGGPSAAVSAGAIKFALASDTGGSIRQPAAFCGVVGMKPTYGLVSRFGLVAFASSLDQIGPITQTVEDNARVLEVIAGHDKHDASSMNKDVPSYTENMNGNVKGMKIAVPKEYLGDGVSEEVRDAIKQALKVYESLGATWEEVSLPHSQYADAAYYIISSAEASASLARYDGVRYGYRSDEPKNMLDMYKQSRSEGFGNEVKRRIMLGTHALSSGYYDVYYDKARKVRTLIKQDFESVFETYDCIVGPTTPTPAFKIGEKMKDPLTMYANDILTIPVNLAGVPGMSIPCGFSKDGLPIGLQVIGNYFDEATVYRAAHAFEQATDHHTKRPELGGESK
ncbi:MAG TPA: Asp-tRNA(Asn)/Glu-tRNA(Gln) amidotransferase subunit GatA [Virgibacillus sp.]|nr:Asp-tRNA(Asn)/Glu-tRNA(Gln) amidotransferase subunit GatA [Virgibacillus sp.]